MVRVNAANVTAQQLRWLSNSMWAYAMGPRSHTHAADSVSDLAMQVDDTTMKVLKGDELEKDEEDLIHRQAFPWLYDNGEGLL